MTANLRNWVEDQLQADAAFRETVERRLDELNFQVTLQGLRKEKGLSQADVARIARVSQPFIARLETGDVRNVELKTLVRAATAVGARVRIELERDKAVPRMRTVREARRSR